MQKAVFQAVTIPKPY